MLEDGKTKKLNHAWFSYKAKFYFYFCFWSDVIIVFPHYNLENLRWGLRWKHVHNSSSHSGFWIKNKKKKEIHPPAMREQHSMHGRKLSRNFATDGLRPIRWPFVVKHFMRINTKESAHWKLEEKYKLGHTWAAALSICGRLSRNCRVHNFYRAPTFCIIFTRILEHLRHNTLETLFNPSLAWERKKKSLPLPCNDTVAWPVALTITDYAGRRENRFQ